jgi:transglutaminase-like putative cysteine protease
MIRLKLSIGLQYEVALQTSDFILNIHAAKTDFQKVVTESLEISPQVSPEFFSEHDYGSRFMRFKAEPGTLTVRYNATVDIDHFVASPATIEETPVAALPPAALLYIYPSRYCQSDRLRNLAAREFGHLRQGYWRVHAISEWVRTRTRFLSGSSNVNTSAVDTVVEQVGVCRDFAHLMIALCRAVNIPARFVSGIDYGADPAMGPTDFHAYVEVFLGDRWYLFDPTGISPPMGLVRIGTGRDAADISFATIFGNVASLAPLIQIEALEDAANGFFRPWHSADGVSSMQAI